MKRGFRPVSINVNGKQLNITLAKITYRCEICGGELTRTNNKLHCAIDGHRGLIHRDKAVARKEQQQENIENLPYQIINGKVEYNGN